MSDFGFDRVIAVDGGGTGCRLALDTGGRRIVAEAGSANVFSDFEGACAVLAEGLRALAGQAGLGLEELHGIPAFLGLAGAVTPGIRDRVAAALPLSRVRVADDRMSALRGALGPRNGAVAHCGTGSFLAMQDAGGARLSGGWGAVLGDEASGYWAGRRALALALDAADGLARGALADAVTETVGGPEAILALGRGAPSGVAALAPAVVAAAEAGDGAAQGILRDGATFLAGRLVAMGWRPGMALCLTGGFAPGYRRYLPGAMQDALIRPEGSPLDGAVALAWEHARRVVT